MALLVCCAANQHFVTHMKMEYHKIINLLEITPDTTLRLSITKWLEVYDQLVMEIQVKETNKD